MSLDFVQRCTDKALADNRRLTIGRYRLIQKKLILLLYLSYLFRLRLLFKDYYLLEGLQSADKTKMQSDKTDPLLPEIEATLMFVYFW